MNHLQANELRRLRNKSGNPVRKFLNPPLSHFSKGEIDLKFS
jgi:hypothetical protein